MINLNPAYGTYVHRAHAANANAIIIRYVSGVISYDREGSGNPCVDSSVGWPRAAAHPGNPRYDWFLYNNHGFGSGNRVVESLVIGNGYWMDVGNTYWQRACAAYNVHTSASYHVDGNFIDEINLCMSCQSFFPGWRLTSATGGYSNDAAWNKAYLSALTAWAAAMHASRQLVIPNIGYNLEAGSAMMHAIVGVTDGSMEEGWPWPRASQDQFWLHKIAEARYNETHGKWFIAVTGGGSVTDEAALTFGLASFLMEANGHSVFDLGALTSRSIWYSELNTAMELGPALGAHYPRRVHGYTIYERDFTNGVALVNPAQNSIPAFAPEPSGGTYSGSGYRNASAVALRADQGLVLLRTGTT